VTGLVTRDGKGSVRSGRTKRQREHRPDCNYCGKPSSDAAPTIPFIDADGVWFHSDCLEAWKRECQKLRV
jgi:hypothetical protein